VVIGTDCIGSCKSNYHVIMATKAPCNYEMVIVLIYVKGNLIFNGVVCISQLAHRDILFFTVFVCPSITKIPMPNSYILKANSIILYMLPYYHKAPLT